MTFEHLDTYLLSKAGATFDYPFDMDVRVYRIAEKMFALIFEKHPLRVNLETIRELIDHSYELVYKRLPKKKREALG